MHEVKSEAAGSTPGRWSLAWLVQHRAPAPVDPAAAPPAPGKWILAASRLTVVLAILAVTGMLAGVSIGYHFAREYDDRISSEQHIALRSIMAEFHSPFVRAEMIDPRLIDAARRIADVKNLKFDPASAANDREIQPVIDAGGRIAGFLSWDKPRPMAQMIGRLASVFAALAVIVFGFAALSIWQLKRARQALAQREAEVARTADEDKLTGLPNHAKTLEFLDLALAERADDEFDDIRTDRARWNGRCRCTSRCIG